MTIEAKERVAEWLTGAETAYLFGAGCSVCAGKPLINELTRNVISTIDPSIKVTFDGLKGVGSRDATIEDLLNYLVRYREILVRLQDASTHPHSLEWVDNSISEIKRGIVDQIADGWIASEQHALFLRRISNSRTANPRDIFVLNYDTVIEATLDALRFPYQDGFRGTRNGWFDVTTFDDSPGTNNNFRLFKLHGSINWVRPGMGEVRRIVVNSGDEITDPVVVFPSEQKYFLTQYGVYETLIARFRERLRSPSSNNCLIVLGYSFNDEHINEALVDAVLATGSNLTIIGFVGPEPDAIAQKARLENLAARCDHRFNAFVGSDYQVGSALNEAEGAVVLEHELWKFENLVTFIAGGTV